MPADFSKLSNWGDFYQEISVNLLTGGGFLPAHFSKYAVADFSKSAVAHLSKSANWGEFLPADSVNLQIGEISASRFH